jgi:hypothetical protein
MAQAILRLVVISIGCLMVAIFAVIGIRWMGLQQSFQAPSHPWFQRPFWAIFTPNGEDLCGKADWQAQIPDKNWIVEIPVKRLGQEDDWILSCQKNVRLADFLKSTKQSDFLLAVQAHDTWSLDKLVEIVDNAGADKHFAVISDAQKVLIYLRKKAPQWLFAADSASLLRLRTYESFYIESAMDFWPDFVITGSDTPESVHLDAPMVQELERRKKRVIWNASEDPRIPVQGIMTNRPSAAQQKWHDRL